MAITEKLFVRTRVSAFYPPQYPKPVMRRRFLLRCAPLTHPNTCYTLSVILGLGVSPMRRREFIVLVGSSVAAWPARGARAAAGQDAARRVHPGGSPAQRSIPRGTRARDARPRLCRRSQHRLCDRWGGDGECTVLSPLRPCPNLYLAGLCPPKPRLGSQRGRSAYCSVGRRAKSGSYRWW